MVPIPEKKSVVVGGNPVIIGTKNVAPNIAAICCKPTPIVRGQVKRSSVETTSPAETDFPSPWSFQLRRDIDVLSFKCGEGRLKGKRGGQAHRRTPRLKVVFLDISGYITARYIESIYSGTAPKRLVPKRLVPLEIARDS